MARCPGEELPRGHQQHEHLVRGIRLVEKDRGLPPPFPLSFCVLIPGKSNQGSCPRDLQDSSINERRFPPPLSHLSLDVANLVHAAQSR